MHSSKIDKILQTMPLKEKIAQLCGAHLQDLLENGKISFERCREVIPNGIGHICQFSSSVTYSAKELIEITKDLQRYLLEETQSKIPAMLHEEAITGIAARGATITPQMIGMGCSWNPQQVYENARMTAQNMKKIGCYYALSPMMDVITDARWGRGEEGYGADGHLVTAFSLAFVKGLQSEGVAATAKHFAGYGVENQDIAHFRNEILVPFEAAVKEGKVSAVMPGYHAFHDVPCTASSFLLTEILRKEWNFDGMVVSDYGAIPQIYRFHHYAENLEEAALAAIKAGVDVEFPSKECYQTLEKAVQSGKISEKEIDRALLRVLKLKERLGLLESKEETTQKETVDLDPAENRERALQSARQAVVLLKNDGILPLTNKPYKIAVVGPNADSYYSLLGDYTWMGIAEYFWRKKGDRNDPRLVTLLEGLRNRLGHCCDIQYERGCDWSLGSEQITNTQMGDERAFGTEKTPLEEIPVTDWNRAITLGASSDIIIAAVGENRYLCGECRDREDVGLPGEQEKLVEQLCSLGKPVILVVFGGRPMAITALAEKCAAVIYAWYPGEEGGNALADIIAGAVNPSGKLTVTLPDSNADVPVFYRQGEKAEKCRYPFGFGMSYTSYEYGDFKTAEKISAADEYFTVRFSIQNVGQRAGAEIAQIYMSAEQMPKKLIGFVRMDLEAGEKKEIAIKIFLDTIAEYNADGELYFNLQEFTLSIGASSVDIRLQKKIFIQGSQRKFSQRTHFLPEITVE